MSNLQYTMITGKMGYSLVYMSTDHVVRKKGMLNTQDYRLIYWQSKREKQMESYSVAKEKGNDPDPGVVVGRWMGRQFQTESYRHTG